MSSMFAFHLMYALSGGALQQGLIQQLLSHGGVHDSTSLTHPGRHIGHLRCTAAT